MIDRSSMLGCCSLWSCIGARIQEDTGIAQAIVVHSSYIYIRMQSYVSLKQDNIMPGQQATPVEVTQWSGALTELEHDRITYQRQMTLY